MCCNQPLQAQARLIGIATLATSIVLVIFAQSALVFCSSGENSSDSEVDSTPRCDVKLNKNYNMSHTVVLSSITIFLVVLDIPSSMILLLGTKVKLKYHLVPWLFTNAYKMIAIVFSFCLTVWCVYVKIKGEIKFHGGNIYYGNQSASIETR